MITLSARRLAPLGLLGLTIPVFAQDAAVAVPHTTDTTSSASSAYDLAIVHVNTPGHPTNVVPGLGIAFKTGGASTSAFTRPTLSSNGVHLAIEAFADTGATATDNVLLRDSTLLLQEGSPAPWAPAENVGTIDDEFGINVLGDLLISHNTSATVNDDYIVLFSGGTWTVLAQEAGSMSTVLPALTGTWDDTMDAARLTDTGLTLWRATGLDGLPGGTANDAVVVLGGGAFLQKGVSVPLNQAGGATEAWEIFDLDDVYVSPIGSGWLVQGDLTGATATDDVLVFTDVVVIQEGSILAGSTFASPVSAIGKPWMDHAGNWYARGSNADGTDWIVRNGVLLAESSGTDEVVAGSGEFWDDAAFSTCFFAHDGNALGHFVFGGVTNGPLDQNGVLVFDDGAGFRRVICRESDPVDLDGNGLFDDDRFFNTFGDDDVLLKDDGTIVFTATLKNGAGTAVDQGLFELRPKTATCTLRNGNGINPVRCSCASLPVLGTTWQIAVTPTINTVLTFAVVTPAAAPTPVPLFGGEVLVNASVGITLIGNGSHPLNLPLLPQFYGFRLFAQGALFEAVGPTTNIVLTNAQEAVLGR